MKKLQIIRKLVQLVFLIIIFTPVNKSLRQLGLIILLGTILIGPFQCGWMCPFGILNDLTSFIARKLNIKRVKIPYSISKYSRYIRYILLALSLIGVNIAGQLDAKHGLLDVLGGKTVLAVTVTATLIFLISSVFVDRLFCNLLCVEGARSGAFGLMRLFSIKRDSNKCVGCQKCTKACPMNIQVSKVDSHVRDAHCIDCMECISSCPKEGALKFGFVEFSSLKKTDYISIILGSIILIHFITLMMSAGGKH